MKRKEVIVDEILLEEISNELKFRRKESERMSRELFIFNSMLEMGLRVEKTRGFSHTPDDLAELHRTKRDVLEGDK